LSPVRAPYLLLSLLIAATLTLTALGGPSPLPGPESASAAVSCPGASLGPRRISSKRATDLVVCLINRARARRGVGRLSQREELIGAARRHSRKMQRTDCFDHVCPGEPALAGRYERADYIPCGCSWGAAENIAWGRRHKGSPRKIVRAWMNSSPHRANILNGAYEHAGVGVRWGSPKRRRANAGTYTLDFGYRR